MFWSIVSLPVFNITAASKQRQPHNLFNINIHIHIHIDIDIDIDAHPFLGTLRSRQVRRVDCRPTRQSDHFTQWVQWVMAHFLDGTNEGPIQLTKLTTHHSLCFFTLKQFTQTVFSLTLCKIRSLTWEDKTISLSLSLSLIHNTHTHTQIDMSKKEIFAEICKLLLLVYCRKNENIEIRSKELSGNKFYYHFDFDYKCLQIKIYHNLVNKVKQQQQQHASFTASFRENHYFQLIFQ